MQAKAWLVDEHEWGEVGDGFFNTNYHELTMQHSLFTWNLLRIYGYLLSSALAVWSFAPKGELSKYGVN